MVITFMQIFNTLSQKKEALSPKKQRINLFVCGPTVYDYPHIGHARTYIVFDVLVRYLKARGFKTFYLQNITDVDDKIIVRAKKENKKPDELARFFTKEYKKDMKKLDVASINKYAEASKFIPEIIKQVTTLINKNYAYKIKDDGIYFDISKFSDYGKLSKRTTEQAEDAISRIDTSKNKKNRGDFCLWKFPKLEIIQDRKWKNYKKVLTRDGEPAWFTPLGWGRPGWHIEDTAITEKFFGPQYDIHGGGIDLKFPHHEAEIAQQESASGKKPFVKIWMHTGSLLVNGKKMSKSLNNFISIEKFLGKYDPLILRWIVLNHHYRSPINYTDSLTNQAQNSLNSVQEFLRKLQKVIDSKNEKGENFNLKNNLKTAQEEFFTGMDNDLNTAFAIAHIFDFGLKYQKQIWQMKSSEAKLLKKYIEFLLNILGINLKSLKLPPKVIKIVKNRELCRTHKQFIQADVLRKKINKLGYEVEDTPTGPFIKTSSKNTP
ncbi:MAG: cysteine--tRNA ligase [Patescibacteria group bacterium]|nr:cysteine--tRNA ligase [Patescibacteria group bacterium]